MRRLFIIRKDLHLSSGKLAAMIGHCCEAYWTNLLIESGKSGLVSGSNDDRVILEVPIDSKIWFDYIYGIFTKTICEARNLNQLRKVDEYIAAINEELDDKHKLVKEVDYGWINDKCLTELIPENEDGTTTVGVWFKPLSDEIAHKISRKFKLYTDDGINVEKINIEKQKQVPHFKEKWVVIDYSDNSVLNNKIFDDKKEAELLKSEFEEKMSSFNKNKYVILNVNSDCIMYGSIPYKNENQMYFIYDLDV